MIIKKIQSKFNIIYLIMHIYCTTYSQNLVLNSDFENFRALQKFPSYEVDSFFCNDWYISTLCTPDYYIEGNYTQVNDKIFKWFDIPYNYFGYHPAKQGKAYIGLVLFNPKGYMELITGTLQKSLIKGKKYSVSLLIKYPRDSVKYFNNFLEFKFSESLNIFSPEYKLLPFRKKVDSFYSELYKNNKINADLKINISAVKDTSEWITVKGYYIAKGGEKYITIGLFYQGNKNSKIILNSYLNYPKINSSKKVRFADKIIKRLTFMGINPYYKGDIEDNNSKIFSYYFIDDVSITEVN